MLIKRRIIRRNILFALFIYFLMAAIPILAVAEDWKVFTDHEEKIQFLSIETPEKKHFGSSENKRIIWHIGYLEDGTNGYIQVIHFREGSLTKLKAVEQARELRHLVESNGRITVIAEQQVSVDGYSAVEFQVKSVFSNGKTWYGTMRMVVISDALYTLSIVAPNKLRLQEKQIKDFLSSFKRIE